MKKTLTGLAIRAALFYFTLVGICQNIQAQSEIRFRLVQNTLVLVSITAGNQGPFDFVLDTGADTTIVDPSIAKALSFKALDHVDQTTLAGVQNLTRGSIPALSVGSVHVENLTALIQDLSGVRRLDPRIEGIAGQNFLSHFNYLLDYRRRVLRIEEADEIRQSLQGNRVAIEFVENRMLIGAEVQARNRAKLTLMLDSGANSLVLFPGASQGLKISPQQADLETTGSGQVGLLVGRVQVLTVGSQEFHDVPAALSPIQVRGHVGDGLLPMSLFQSLYVNNREGFVILNPLLKKT